MMKRQETYHWLPAFLVSACLLIISFFLDKPVAAVFQGLDHPMIKTIMLALSNVTAAFILLSLIISLYVCKRRKERIILPMVLAFAASLIACYLIKFAIARPRPLGLVQLIPFINHPDHSFPSSHAATTFSVVPALDAEFPRLKWLWIAFALGVCVSRIYLGVHYLSDTVAGALLGYWIGKVFLVVLPSDKKKRLRA